jgi:hypothetical protein
MKKLLILTIALSAIVSSCKKSSTSSPSSNLSSWVINGASYNTNNPSNSIGIYGGYWAGGTDSLNESVNSLQALGGVVGYDSTKANTSINLYTYDHTSFCLTIAFKNRPTSNKTYSICSALPYYDNTGMIVNTNTTDSTCTVIGALLDDIDNNWFGYKPTDKVVVTINNGKITASLSNLSLIYQAINGNGSTNYTTISGTLIEGK